MLVMFYSKNNIMNKLKLKNIITEANGTIIWTRELNIYGVLNDEGKINHIDLGSFFTVDVYAVGPKDFKVVLRQHIKSKTTVILTKSFLDKALSIVFARQLCKPFKDFKTVVN